MQALVKLGGIKETKQKKYMEYETEINIKEIAQRIERKKVKL